MRCRLIVMKQDEVKHVLDAKGGTRAFGRAHHPIAMVLEVGPFGLALAGTVGDGALARVLQ